MQDLFRNSGGLIGGGCVGLSRKEAQYKNAPGRRGVEDTAAARLCYDTDCPPARLFTAQQLSRPCSNLCTALDITHAEAAPTNDSTNTCAVQHLRPTTRISAASLWPHAVKLQSYAWDT